MRLVPRRPDDDTIYLATIELSSDGTSWTPIDTWFEPDDRATLIDRPLEVRWFEARFPATPARAVRIRASAASYRGGIREVAEVGVLEPAGDAPTLEPEGPAR